jgi:hypothetical protein
MRVLEQEHERQLREYDRIKGKLWELDEKEVQRDQRCELWRRGPETHGPKSGGDGNQVHNELFIPFNDSITALNSKNPTNTRGIQDATGRSNQPVEP